MLVILDNAFLSQTQPGERLKFQVLPPQNSAKHILGAGLHQKWSFHEVAHRSNEKGRSQHDPHDTVLRFTPTFQAQVDRPALSPDRTMWLSPKPTPAWDEFCAALKKAVFLNVN